MISDINTPIFLRKILMTVKEITEEAIYFQEKNFCDKPKMNQIIQASW